MHLYLREWKLSRSQFNNMYQKTKIFITLGSLIPLLEINTKEIVYNIDKVLVTMMFVEMSLKMVKIRNNLDI